MALRWEYLTATRGGDGEWVYDPPDPALPSKGEDVAIIEAVFAAGGWLLEETGSPLSFRREAPPQTEREPDQAGLTSG